LDKANQNAILFERSFVDTAGVDASLTTAEFTALSGITTYHLVRDSGPPVISGTGGGVGMFQFTDGRQPPVDALWDNFSMCLHDVPPIGIARAVRLSWPTPAGVNYAVESAPAVQGPWLPIQESPAPVLQQVTVPAGDLTRFFRLRLAP
jgi:hypothetical protein